MGTALAAVSRGLALFGLAFLARLLFVGDARWTSEESYFFAWVHDLAEGRKWDGLGTPVSGSKGWHPGPWFFLLLAPFAKISTSPWAVAIGVALLDSLAVVLGWAGLKELLGPGRRRAAWLAGLLLALSPWALLYGDRPWNSNLVSLPAAMILLGLGLWWRGRGGPWGLILALAGCSLFPSFHLSAPLFWAPLAALLYLGRARGFAGFLPGIALAIAIQGPYLQAELRRGWQNSRQLLESGNSHAHRSTGNSLLALSWPLRLSSLEIGYHAQQGYWGEYRASAPLLHPDSLQGRRFWELHRGLAGVAMLLSLLLAIGAWIFWLNGLRWRELNEDPFSFFLIGGTLLGWGLIFAASRRAYPHYLQPLLPLYLGLMGLAWAALERRFRGWGRWLPVLLLLAGLQLTARYYAERDRPYGLQANLETLALLEQLDGEALPIFCGDLAYRSGRQLEQIARIAAPELKLKPPHSLALVHLNHAELPPELYRRAIWRKRRHGQWISLVDRPLPEALKALDCGS